MTRNSFHSTGRMVTLIIAVGLVATAIPALAQGLYTINGQPAPQQVEQYLAAMDLPAGDYWIDARGYWGVMGQPPLGNIYSKTHVTRSGGGEQASSGWTPTTDSPTAGGDSKGCFHAGSWSNC